MKLKHLIAIMLLIATAAFCTGLTITLPFHSFLKGSIKFIARTAYIDQWTGYYGMGDTTDASYGWGIYDTLRAGEAVKTFWAINTSGGALARGDCVIWDVTLLGAVDTVAYTSDPETLTVAASLEGEVTPLYFATTTFSLADACSIDVVYSKFSGDSTGETIIHTADGTKAFTYYADSLTQVIVRGWDANDSVVVFAYNTCCVTTTTSGNSNLAAGVVYTGGADNTWIRVAYEGVMDSVKVNCSSVAGAVGKRIQTSTAVKKAAPVASITDGAPFGIMLEPGFADGTYRVLLKLGE